MRITEYPNATDRLSSDSMFIFDDYEHTQIISAQSLGLDVYRLTHSSPSRVGKFTIPVESWIASTLYPEYSFEARLNANDEEWPLLITTISDLVNIYFDPESLLKANSAGIVSILNTPISGGTNGVTIYSEQKPSSVLTGFFVHFMGGYMFRP